MADAIPRTLSLLGADVPLQGGFPSLGTSKVQLLQVTAPAVVRWLKKMECPLSQGKPTPAGGWDCRAHSGVPGARQLHQPGQVWLHKSQVGTDRTGTQGHSCPLSPHTHPQPLHTAPFPWLHPWLDDPSLAGTAAKVLCIYLKISI